MSHFNLNGYTAEQLEALIKQAKEQKKNAKSKKQMEEDERKREIVKEWEGIEWKASAIDMTNDERLRILCAHYGLKVAHKRKGRHQERTIGESCNRPNGQYSNIVANCEERFKYELMGKAWRGAKTYTGKGKSRVYVGTEFDLQKAFKPIWGKLTNPQKKAVWHHKFSNEWWKVGDDPSVVDAPTERTNSKAFMIWWDENVVSLDGKWVFKESKSYNVNDDFLKYFYLAIKEDKKSVKQSAKAPVNNGGGAKPETKKKTKEQEDAQNYLTEFVGKSAVKVRKAKKAKMEKKKAEKAKAEKKQSKAEDYSFMDDEE